MHAPPAPFIPEHRVGELVLMILAVWTGDIEAGEKAFAPLRALAEPVADLIAPMPYPAIYQFTAPQEQPHGAAIRSMFADGHSDRHFRRHARGDGRARRPQEHGAVPGHGRRLRPRRRPPRRPSLTVSARFFTTVLGLWDDRVTLAARHQAWTENLWERIRGGAAGVYVNFLGAEGDARIRDAYPAGTYERLVAVKEKYDPQNMFRFNQNIRPRA